MRKAEIPTSAPERPSALVFDFDGTMIDTEAVEYASLSALWLKNGRVLPYDEWARYLGTDAPDWVEALVSDHPDDLDPDELRLELHRDQEERTALEQMRPGVASILEAATTAGVPLAIASNSPPRRLISELERRDLVGLFGAVVTRDQVSRGKPAPDPYTIAATRLGVDSSKAIAFEDSVAGMQAALSAGYRCVVAPTPATVHQSFVEAHLLLRSFDELSIPDLIEGELVRRDGASGEAD